MNVPQKQRLIAIIFLVLGVTLAMAIALYALRQNINLFFTPSDLVTAKVSGTKTIRLGGMVEKGSIKRGEGLKVEFSLTDTRHNIQVEYQGVLPDLFKEGQGIVTLGRLNEHGVFVAQEVLAKHDENYMPPQLNDMKKMSEASQKT